MKRVVFVILFFLSLNLMANVVNSQENHEIHLNKEQTYQIVSYLVEKYDLNSIYKSPEYVYGFGSPDSSGTSDLTLDKICFYANYTNHPDVSNKKMINANFIDASSWYPPRPGMELNYRFSSPNNDVVIYWSKSSDSWDHSCCSHSMRGFSFSGDKGELYIICNVEYTDFSDSTKVEWKVIDFSSNEEDNWCEHNKFLELGLGHENSREFILNTSLTNLKGKDIEGVLYSKVFDSDIPSNYYPYLFVRDDHPDVLSEIKERWAGSPLESTQLLWYDGKRYGVSWGIIGDIREVEDSDFSLSPVYEIDLYDWYEQDQDYHCKNIIRYSFGKQTNTVCIPLTQENCTNKGYGCGEMPDNCGENVNCGACNEGYNCVDFQCVDAYLPNYWTNMLGERITLTGLNHLVKINSSEEPTYTIFDDDGEIELDEKIWQVTRLHDGDGFNFSTSLENYAEDLLKIDPTIKRSPMHIEILEPSCGDDFNLEGDEVSVKIKLNVTDPDDIINGNISVNGMFFKNFDNLNGPIVEFDYVFDEVGNMNIVVDAKNSVEKKKVLSNIMVYDNTSQETQYYVASCIDEPKHFELFPTNRVKFNASSSRGIKWDGTNLVNIPFENLLFNWTFELSNGAKGTPCVGMGNQDCFGEDVSAGEISVIYFYRYFPTIDNNKAFLRVSIDDNYMA